MTGAERLVRIQVAGLYDEDGDLLSWIEVPKSSIPGILLTAEEADAIRTHLVNGYPCHRDRHAALLTPQDDDLPHDPPLNEMGC
jgi:hypothetical protein